jgi:DNA-binding phage protein
MALTARRPKTGFDTFFESQMANPEFAAAYAGARAEIDGVDELVRALDEARIAVGLTKAELARRIDAKPEVVRRLFTTDDPNPTMATVVKLATVLGLRFELVPRGPRKATPRRSAARRAAT